MESLQEKQSICPICGQSFKGVGNNPFPLNFDRVCDECNFRVVIPTRMKILKQRKLYDKVEN